MPVTVAVPLFPPLQDTEVLLEILADTALGSDITTDAVAGQLFWSDTVTV